MRRGDVSERGAGPGAVPAVEASELVVRYGDQVAVDTISISVAEGSTTAVVGPSGSGKSTLLRAIAGLEPVDEGSVALFGADCTTVPTNERHVGLMFQDHALFPHLDVAGNVAFGMKMQHQDRTHIPDRVDEVLDLVGLAGFGGRQIDTLSGGEAQRVALARSLAPSPKVLLLDEPLGSLDRVLREGLVGELRRLFARLDLTVIHVTHDQQEAFSLGDEVVVMRDGRIEQVGPPSELWRRPSTVFVAEFLGHPNIWATADGAVLAPMSSLAIGPPTAGTTDEAIEEVEVVVVDVEFREGRHRITAVERPPSGREGRRFVVDSDVPPEPTTPSVVAIDTTQLVALAPHGSHSRVARFPTGPPAGSPTTPPDA